MIRYLIALLLLALAAGVTRADTFDDGMQALRDGDFAVAYCLWQPLARSGHADAQYNLGWLYANGNGLRVDPRKAVYWWQQAARAGHVDAQFALGMAYSSGDGLKADQREAFRWFAKAAHNGSEDAREFVRSLLANPTRNDLEIPAELFDEPWLRKPLRVTRDGVNLRNGPGMDRPVIAQLDRKTRLTGFVGKNNWARVWLEDGVQGWVYAPLLTADEQ